MDELFQRGITLEVIINELRKSLDRCSERVIDFNFIFEDKYRFKPLELDPILYKALHTKDLLGDKKFDSDAISVARDISEEFLMIREILLKHELIKFYNYEDDPKGWPIISKNMPLESKLSAYTLFIWRSVCYSLRLRGGNVYMFLAINAPFNFNEVRLSTTTTADFIQRVTLVNDIYLKSLKRAAGKLDLWRKIGGFILSAIALMILTYISFYFG